MTDDDQHSMQQNILEAILTELRSIHAEIEKINADARVHVEMTKLAEQVAILVTGVQSVTRPEEVERIIDGGMRDELLPDVQRLVVEAGVASTAFLQRKFDIGYARASGFLMTLEEMGIVSPADGMGRREVFMAPAKIEVLEKIEAELKKAKEKGEQKDVS